MTIMQKAKNLILITTLVLAIFSPFLIFGEEKVIVHFFKTETCPHCKAEDAFLTQLEEKYQNLEVRRYDIYQPENQSLMRQLAKEHGAERYLGSVPLTFIGDKFFIGFDNAGGIGKQIEAAIKGEMSEPKTEENQNDKSLFATAVSLGFLDGFNVCSLGALALILGMVLMLGSRKKILLFGGIFILTTAVIYGLLIVLWYKFFSLLTPYMKWMEIVIGLIGLGGAVYFFKEFLRFRKYGPTCEMSGAKTVGKLTSKLQNAFKNPKGIFSMAGVIILFAAVITIVEFPCSAAIPVVFAGILSQAEVSSFSYLLYIGLFVLFYMLDELIVFGVAASKMRLWLTNSKWTTWITLAEALILATLGLYYLVGAL